MKMPDRHRVARRTVSTGTPEMSFAIDMAVGIWRLEQSLRREYGANEDLAETRPFKNLERLWTQLERRGITVQDKTGEPFDPGMSVRVVASEEQPDLTREMVQETITPSIFYHDALIHAGEIVVGKPPATDSEPNPESDGDQ